MKPIDPQESLRQAGGGNPHIEEVAQMHAHAHRRAEHTSPSTTSIPVKDSTFSNGGGRGLEVHPRGDDAPFPSGVAMLSGSTSIASAPSLFPTLTPNEPDGFEDRGSGVDNIVRGGR